jgi:amino acid transporter
MWFRMAKGRSLPNPLAKVNAKCKPPANTILAQVAISLIGGLGVGAWIGADKSFFLVDGLVLVMAVLFVYVGGRHRRGGGRAVGLIGLSRQGDR